MQNFNLFKQSVCAEGSGGLPRMTAAALGRPGELPCDTLSTPPFERVRSLQLLPDIQLMFDRQ